MLRWQVGSFTMAQMGQSKSVIGEFMKQKRKVCPSIVTHPTRCLAVCENRGHNWHHQCGHEREWLRPWAPWTDGHWPEMGPGARRWVLVWVLCPPLRGVAALRSLAGRRASAGTGINCVDWRLVLMVLHQAAIG